MREGDRKDLTALFKKEICSSVTSEKRHDTQDQRECLRGIEPQTKSEIFLIFGYFWEMLEKNMYIAKVNAF